ncbi:MAG TPA: hypothetical protein DDW52_20855 [Planctomycetaceae bacterium]|nr:hypothetical protein [Planctomycetaceae bacterium]
MPKYPVHCLIAIAIIASAPTILDGRDALTEEEPQYKNVTYYKEFRTSVVWKDDNTVGYKLERFEQPDVAGIHFRRKDLPLTIESFDSTGKRLSSEFERFGVSQAFIHREEHVAEQLIAIDIPPSAVIVMFRQGRGKFCNVLVRNPSQE